MWKLKSAFVSLLLLFVSILLLLLASRSSGSSSSSSNDGSSDASSKVNSRHAAEDNLKRDPGFCDDPCVPGKEEIMSIKGHGTSETPVQPNLRWGCTWSNSDRLANFNRELTLWISLLVFGAH